MHYYQHHIGDFIRDTARLSDGQCIAYLRLLWMYYDTEQPLPNNPRILAFKIGSSIDDVELTLEAYFQITDDHWHHARCDKEIGDYRAFCEKQAANGKRGGRPKKTQRKPNGNPTETQRKPNGNPEVQKTSENETQNNPNHYPLTNISTTDVVDRGADAPQAKRQARASQIDPAFYPDETGVTLAEEMRVSIATELPKFIDHFKGKGESRKDWQATFRTWIRNSAEFAARRSSNNVRVEKFDPVAYVNQNRKGATDVTADSSAIDGTAQRVV